MPQPRAKAAKEVFSMPDFIRRLRYFVLMLLLPLFALVAFDIYSQYRTAVDGVTESGLRIVRAAAFQQQTAADATEPFLDALADAPEVRHHDAVACDTLFAELLSGNPLYANFGAVSADGEVFCSGLPLVGPVNVAKRTWFTRAMATGGFAAGEYEVGAVSKKRTVNFGLPFKDDAGNVAGVVYAALDVERLNDLAQNLNLPAASTFAIFDREGNVLARYPDAQRWVGRNVKDEPVFRAMFGGPLSEGVYEASGLDDVARVYAFTPLNPRIASSPLVAIGFSKAVMFRDIFNSVALNVAGLLLITVIVLFLAFVGGRELLVRRVAALQEVDRLKGEFVSLASHQLRTPLAAIRWLSELLGSGASGELNVTQKRMVAEVEKSAGQLIGLVNELLDIGRLDAGKLKVKPAPFDLARTAEGVKEELAPLSDAKGLSVTVEAAPGLPRAYADPLLAREAVLNLLSNAIKYSGKGGTVRLSVERTDRAVRISVIDGGIGIPLEDQGRIFERFFRASNVMATQPEGTGLGLAVARALVESMGGKIGFVSEAGKGSTFWIALPAEKQNA